MGSVQHPELFDLDLLHPGRESKQRGTIRQAETAAAGIAVVNPQSAAAGVKTGSERDPDVFAQRFGKPQAVVTLREGSPVARGPAPIKALAAWGAAQGRPAGQHRSALVQFQQPLALSIPSLKVRA